MEEHVRKSFRGITQPFSAFYLRIDRVLACRRPTATKVTPATRFYGERRELIGLPRVEDTSDMPPLLPLPLSLEVCVCVCVFAEGARGVNSNFDPLSACSYPLTFIPFRLRINDARGENAHHRIGIAISRRR
jgi:hypothetical protein